MHCELQPDWRRRRFSEGRPALSVEPELSPYPAQLAQVAPLEFLEVYSRE